MCIPSNTRHGYAAAQRGACSFQDLALAPVMRTHLRLQETAHNVASWRAKLAEGHSLTSFTWGKVMTRTEGTQG